MLKFPGARGLRTLTASLAIILPALASPLVAATPELVAAAQREGKVIVYSVLSSKAAQPLIDDFQSLYPGIKVDYDGEKGSNDMDERYRTELAAGQSSADVVWSSATDMQMQLVSEGYAACYQSPEADKLPRWAVYKDRAFGTTLEPVALVYNRELLSGADIPQDRNTLIQMLKEQRHRFAGKLTGFDIASSGVGFMFAAQDRRNFPALDKLLAQFGAAGFRPLAGTGDMLMKINSGDFLLGYNMMGSYALLRSRKDLPNLGVAFPRDYTLAFPRVAFVSKRAAHPNAARLWLDYLLSSRGQKLLGGSLQLFPLRSDADADNTAAKLQQQLGASVRIIPVNMKLLKDLRPERKAALLTTWNKAMASISLDLAGEEQ